MKKWDYILNEISELIYVSDMNTYELLFLNDEGRRMFNIQNIENKKCYEVLQGRTSPCSFCTNPLLSEQEFYRWEIKNPMTNRTYLLKDKIVQWENRRARMEIAFDIEDKEQQNLILEKNLRSEQVILECVKELHQTQDLAAGIQFIIKNFGGFLQADRVQIFEFEESIMHNTYEWCNANVSPRINHLKTLEKSPIDRWIALLKKQECVIIRNLADIKTSEAEYEILIAQNIRSLVAAPLLLKGNLIGFLGIVNLPETDERIMSMLKTIGYFIASSLDNIQTKKILERLSFSDALTGLNNRNRFIYDMEKIEGAGISIGVIFIDINGLKNVNDLYGHTLGDQLIIAIANKIKGVFAEQFIYRIGGDEFIVLHTDVQESLFIKHAQELKQIFLLNPNCSAALGYKWSANVKNVYQLTNEVDSMMYEEKKRYYRTHPFTERYRCFNDEILELIKIDQMKRA